MDLHREHGARAQDKGQGTGKGTSDLILIFRFLCWVGQQYYSVCICMAGRGGRDMYVCTEYVSKHYVCRHVGCRM